MLCFLILCTVSARSQAYTQKDLDKLIETGSSNNGYLTYANLSNKNLKNANLSGANLFGANLASSCFIGSDFSGTNLEQADLSMADLSNSNLTNANLQSAILKNTDMKNSDLTNVDFKKADLAGANLINAKFMNTNLCNALNLETVIFSDDIKNTYVVPYLRDKNNVRIAKDVQSATYSSAQFRVDQLRREYQWANHRASAKNSVNESKLSEIRARLSMAEAELFRIGFREQSQLRDVENKLARSEVAMRKVSNSSQVEQAK